MENQQNYTKFKVEIDGKDVTRYVPFPIKWEKMLDERLDVTRITMKHYPQAVFHPLTPCTITMTDKNGKQVILNNVITTDTSVEVLADKGKYNHEIFMLEETKILEGILVDALTFTNDLGRNYTGNAQDINVSIDAQKVGANNVAYYPNTAEIQSIRNSKSPKKDESQFTFMSIKKLFGDYANIGSMANKWSNCYLHVTHFGTKIVDDNYTNSATNTGSNGLPDIDHAMSLGIGTYDVEYYINFLNNTDYYTIVRYSFSVVENKNPLPLWNIATVIDRVLDLAEPHLQGVAPRFQLNAEQHAEFEKIEAPEFAFTNCTLREALDQIGGYIHGMARLRGKTIYYDMLGGTKQAAITAVESYSGNIYKQDIESYCTALDSTVDNLVCLLDPEQGTITEPYYDGYKTVRTETVYARIDADNMYIATQFPIQEIKSVKCGAIPNRNFAGGDITAYVFEEAEYNRMSAYSKSYPNSKVYALYYTQGQKNIYGLNFHVETASGWVSDNAIVRILKETTGQSINGLDKNYPLLSFQVSYIPVFSARVQQTKQYIGEYKQPRTLYYNQNANLIETRHYGENMKGAVARLGNVDRTIIYRIASFKYVPEIGEMFGDDYWISGVTCEILPEFIKCQVELTQDFNRISQYIGINSRRRFYEVSEKAAYRRNMKYADYIVIGDQVEADETLTDIAFINAALTQPTLHSVSHMVARGYSESGSAVGAQVLLPVISTAQGNAMVFTANYEDNYSAGTQVQRDKSGAVEGYFTNAVEYADYYGRMETLKFSMYTQTSEDTSDQQLTLPAWNQTENGVSAITTGDNALVVKKDGSEILSLNYILEFVTNRKNIVIGSAFARNCPLVRGTDIKRQARLYVLPNRLNKFATVVDLSGATEVPPVWTLFPTQEKWLKLNDFTPEVDGSAWAIVDGYSGELLLGSNETITAGQTVSMPYLTLRHDIFNLGGNQ